MMMMHSAEAMVLKSVVLPALSPILGKLLLLGKQSRHACSCPAVQAPYTPALLLEAPAAAAPAAGVLAVSAANMLNTCCSCVFEKPSRWSRMLAK